MFHRGRCAMWCILLLYLFSNRSCSCGESLEKSGGHTFLSFDGPVAASRCGFAACAIRRAIVGSMAGRGLSDRWQNRDGKGKRWHAAINRAKPLDGVNRPRHGVAEIRRTRHTGTTGVLIPVGKDPHCTSQPRVPLQAVPNVPNFDSDSKHLAANSGCFPGSPASG